MQEYEGKFTDAGDIRWLPYLMYFHPTNHRSSVVNTDSIGFRYSKLCGETYSIGDYSAPSINIIAGSSTVFGIGASSDAWTLSSRLSAHDKSGTRWLNFGGRSFNSTQELMLLVLYRHLFAKVDEIVLFSGFNNLALTAQPSKYRLEHGAFFNCFQFFDAFPDSSTSQDRQRFRFFGKRVKKEEPIPLEARIDLAVELTVRHLQSWSAISRDLGAKLTFILQPLAGWIRSVGSIEEEAIFAELDSIGRFTDQYGDILGFDVLNRYAQLLGGRLSGSGINFVNISPLITASATPDEWLFVDRIHFTDHGNDAVAQIILDVC